MFSENPDARERARKCMITYCSKVMTASYPDLELSHTIPDKENENCLGKLFPVSDQEIRNLRHKTKCVEARGVIAKCNTYDRTFTTVQIVNTHSTTGK